MTLEGNGDGQARAETRGVFGGRGREGGKGKMDGAEERVWKAGADRGEVKICTVIGCCIGQGWEASGREAGFG